MGGGGGGAWHAIRQGMLEDTKNVSLKRSWPYLKRCLPFLKPYIKHIIAGSIGIIMETGAGLLRPIIVMTIIDKVIPQGSGGFRLLALLLAGWLGLALAENIVALVHQFLFTYMNQSVFHDLRTKLFRHIQRLPVSHFDANQTGMIMSRITNDTAALSGVFGTTFTQFVINSLEVIGITVAMFYMHPVLALLSLITIPFFALSYITFRNKMRVIQRRTQEKIAAMTGTLQEKLSGIRIIKSFVREAHEDTEFTKKSHEVVEYQIKRQITSSLGGMITGIIGVIGPLVITGYGVIEIINGNLTLGAFFAFNQWIARLLRPARHLVMLMFGIQFSLGAAERVFDVFDTPDEDHGRKDLLSLPEKPAGNIQFQEVSFGYGKNEDVLSGFNMEIAPGGLVALVGLSGAGKSTIAKLLLRFYSSSSGAITIDGIDINSIDLSSLRDAIGFIDQDTFLFNTSVKENILYGKAGASDAEVISAAKAADAHEFIMSLPDEYETVIGERGVKLSGGQKQRVSIARTFLKDPSILILDEATSSLDSESESAIYETLDELVKGRTTIIISHRLATLQQSDRIYVLEKGKTIQEGKHIELISEEGLYKNLFELQDISEKGTERRQDVMANRARRRSQT